MFSTIADIHPYLLYTAPPLVGAFIGYLTNRVAIRMLFRPLTGWYLGPFKIPMTPGVIPSKRHELAVNIGEMVGEHLVTGDEINRALQKDDFQEHLRLLIEVMVASFTKKEFGSIRSIVPKNYATYLDIACRTVIYRIKESIRLQIGSDETENKIETLIDTCIDQILATPLEEIISAGDRQRAGASIADILLSVVEQGQLEERLAGFFEGEIGTLLQSGQSTIDILPEQLSDGIIEVVRNQTPHVLDQAAGLIKDPDIQDRLVEAVKKAMDEFIDTLGPMSAMARGFLNHDMVEDKIRAYLEDKEGDIEAFFHDEAVVIRVRAALGERVGSLLATPLADLGLTVTNQTVPALAGELAGMVSHLLRKGETKEALAELLRSSLERKLAEHGDDIGSLLDVSAGPALVGRGRSRIRKSAVAALQSREGLSLIDHVVDELGGSLLAKPIGRLDRLVPSGVIEGVCRSLREIVTRVLVAEVPAVVTLIRIKDMVTDKIDSYDLLRLEQLLLSIMAEQFKYINLFGALLGFIIGCANLLFLVGG